MTDKVIVTIEAAGKKLISVLDTIGKDTVKVIADVDKYAPEAEAVALALFPQYAVEIKAGDATFIGIADLLSKTVQEIEAKASALPAGLTDTQKAADVLSIVSSSVLAALASKGIAAGSDYVQKLVNAVVGLLNIPSVQS